MLDLMRRRKKRLKIVLWLVILSLGLGMLLFFVPGVNMGTVVTDTTAASVDGLDIGMQEYSNTYRRALDNYSNGGRNQLSPELLKSLGVPRQVLDSMIMQKVVEVAARRLGLEVTPEEVRQAVETHPNLQDQNGRFIGVARYKQLLAANRISIADFEKEVRYAQLATKLRHILTDSLTVGERELRDEFSRNNQQTVVEYVIIRRDDLKKRIKPTESELRAYFEGHKELYRIKEKRRAQYILVPVTPLFAAVDVTEQEILAAWDRRPHGETVEASHILFRVEDESKDAEIRAKAESVLKAVKSGGDFAALAKKHSEDDVSAENGGALGSFQRGQMVKEFEDAAFALKPGEISGLVRSQFGYHIIKVTGREVPSLEAARPSLMLEVRRQKAQELAKQKAEQAAASAAQQKDLNAVIKGLGVPAEIKDTALFDNDDNPFDLGISQDLRDEVFKLKEIGSVGAVVEHAMGYAVPRLAEVQLAKPGDFALSRSQVEQDFIDAKARELMQTEAKKLSEDAAKQGSLAAAAKGMGLSVKTSDPFNISGNPGSDISASSAFNQAAFELAPGGVSAPVQVLDDLAVMQVKSRTPFDEAAYLKQREDLRARLLQSIQDPYFEDYIRRAAEELEKAGKIKRNEKALEWASTVTY